MNNVDTIIPAAVTAGALARALNRTERVIAGRKADGRLPVLEGGRIDLHAIIRAGVDALATRKRNGEAPADPGEQFEAGLRMAAFTTAHMVLGAVQAPKPGEDAATAGARALRDVLALLEIDAPREDRAPVPPRLVALAGGA